MMRLTNRLIGGLQMIEDALQCEGEAFSRVIFLGWDLIYGLRQRQ